MPQPQRADNVVSDAFGEDRPAVTYNHIADQVRTMKPRALTPSQFDDVVVLIEWMQGEALKAHQRNETQSKELSAREAAVAKRERDVGIRQRAIVAAIRAKGVMAPLRRYFGR
jgi:hypothetical protein